jgi:hypothetical protein
MFNVLVRRGTWAPRRLLLVGLVTLAASAVAAVPAMAEHHPKGIYAPFSQCPTQNTAVNTCLFAATESGEFVVGTTAVPIKNTITLQGGLHQNEAEGGILEGVAAENGNTLSKTPQPVPGGLAGLVKCFEITNLLERIACEVTFQNGLTGVNATTELAGPASAIKVDLLAALTASGTALSMPVKVHLENPFLGGACYIGSNSNPIVLHLTTGTTSPPPPNKPITGSPGEFEFLEEANYAKVRKNSLVDNSFAAPVAEGCGGLFAFLIDPLIDAKLALPSAAGHNTAILNGTLQLASAAAVKASE